MSSPSDSAFRTPHSAFTVLPHCRSRLHCEACRNDPAFRQSLVEHFGPFDCPLAGQMPAVVNLVFDTRPLVVHAPGLTGKNLLWQAVKTEFFLSEPKSFGVADGLTILTWNSRREPGVLQQCLDHLGVPHVVLGQGIRDWRNLLKNRLTRDALDEVTTKYVMGIDASDALVLGHPQAILDRFKAQFSCKLLLGAETHCFPEIAELRRFEDSLPGATSPWHYLNSGMWIGETAFCREFFRVAAETDPWPGDERFQRSDQGVLKKVFRRFYPVDVLELSSDSLRLKVSDRLAGLVAAALLTKGPILYAFLLPALGCWPLLRRCGRVRSALGTGWWPWALPFLVFLAWVAAGIAQDPEFREQVVDREFLGRFTTGETAVHRSQPLWFYAVHLLHKLAPWSLLAAGLGWAVWRRARPGSRTGAGSPPEGLRDADRWLIALVAGGLVVMSFIPSKRVDRVFALVPSLALLIPCLVRAAGGWPPHRRLLAVCLAVAVVFSGGYAVVRPIRAVRADEGALARFGRETLALARAGGLRIGVVRSPREGVAAYLRDPRPVPAAEARRRWMQGALDGVLVLESDWKRGGWQPAGRVVGSVEIPDGRGATLFVLREESAGP